MIADFLEFLSGAVFTFIAGIISIIPDMPVDMQDISSYLDLDGMSYMLSWVNYFLPLDTAASIIGLWIAAIFGYLAVKMALKFTGKIV